MSPSSKRSRFRCVSGTNVLYIALMLLLPVVASAGKILDFIRNYDLNDYALGVNISVAQRPYTNTSDSLIVYPYLTSFVHATLTNDWLLIADGDVGMRKVTAGGWVFGAVGRIQTLGFGSEIPDELEGLSEKRWAVELAPLLAYRGWPVHITGKTYKEVSGRHGGWISELRLELPLKRSWGYVVPSIKASRLDETYANYYYQVTPLAAAPGRPEYSPGAATNLAVELSLGYQLSENWLLSGNFGYEKLDKVIADSPIVDKDSIWSADIGLAYNANIFRSREFGADTYMMPRYEFRVGMFQNNIRTRVVRDSADGSPGETIDLEDFLNAADSKTVLDLGAIVRLNSFHRLEFGYFNLARASSATIENNIQFGAEEFQAGTRVDVQSDLRITRVAYAFSLMHDAQKELGVMAGVHLSRLDIAAFAPDTGQRERSVASTPLPVIGVHGSVALGQKTFLASRVQIFRMQFDDYSGSMNYANLELQHVVGNRTSVGIGFNFFDLKLDSDNDGINGRLEIRHYGPFVFVGAHF
jgi:outer membrane scaffolding protein for murein synthesis (MipA/OmpV family)